MDFAPIPALDALLAAHADALGGDFAGYRNHASRVAHLCAALVPGPPPAPAQLRKIAVAAALHDLGIWTDGTFDYLAPSVRLAEAHLAAAGLGDWTPEIVAMILAHHKLTPWRGRPDWLVEPFRRADWIDVTGGVVAFGPPRGMVRALYAEWPGAGFHRRLVRLAIGRLRAHPLRPLPMLRL